MLGSSGERWLHGWRWWALGACLGAVYLGVALRQGVHAAPEALARDGICRQMMTNQTAGRQGLVSSAWWGPVSTLAVLPAAFLCRTDPDGVGAVATGAFLAAGVLLGLERALRRRGAGAWRWGLVLAAGLCPTFMRAATDGSSATLVALLLLVAADSLIGWIESRHLRDLVVAGVALGLLLATGIDAWGWVVAAVMTLAVTEWRHAREAGERRAVMVLGLLPPAYLLGLWVLLSWLIMGDALYFVRPLAQVGPGPGRDFALSRLEAGWYAVLMGVAVAVAVVAVARRRRGEVSLALLVLALPASAGLLAGRGFLWSPAPLLVAMPALLAMAVARVLQERRATAPGGWIVALAGVSAAVTLGMRWPQAVAGPRDTAWLQALDRHVQARSRYATVFVCGYDGLALLREGGPRSCIACLDFDFERAKRDYYGHVLYVLVRRPDAVYAMESVLRSYPRMFVQGGPDTLYDSDWGHAGEWRLFEVIQSPWTR